MKKKPAITNIYNTANIFFTLLYVYKYDHHMDETIITHFLINLKDDKRLEDFLQTSTKVIEKIEVPENVNKILKLF